MFGIVIVVGKPHIVSKTNEQSTLRWCYFMDPDVQLHKFS